MNSLPNKLTGNYAWSTSTVTLALAVGAVAFAIPPIRRMIIKAFLNKAVNAGGDTIDKLANQGAISS